MLPPRVPMGSPCVVLCLYTCIIYSHLFSCEEYSMGSAYSRNQKYFYQQNTFHQTSVLKPDQICLTQNKKIESLLQTLIFKSPKSLQPDGENL